MKRFIHGTMILAAIGPNAHAAAEAMARRASTLSFKVTFDTRLQKTPYTGRVYVMLAEGAEPRRRVHSFQQWINASPVFAIDVKAHDPEQPLVFGVNCQHHPYALANLPKKTYQAQAVARRNLDSSRAGLGEQDLISEPVVVDLNLPAGEVTLNLDQAVVASPPRTAQGVEIAEMVSPLLSRFHGREVKMRAGVRLPAGWKENPTRRYPVLYSITGFGGGPESVGRMASRFGGSNLADDVLMIVPDATCYRGHHVFADSANNGPVGRAFVEEFVPYLEARYRGAMSPEHRYLTGGSSGGWSSLWLQITYPDVFNGCWSDVPDPVDFRDFQRINLYAAGANMYRDEKGDRRPLMRRREQVMVHYEDFVKAEDVLGPGGQIHSFEAVFSPRGPDGAPLPLFDRATGAVNAAVAKAWEAYDIRLILERNWKTLGPKLAGKLRIYAGEFDNFYLEGAVRLLKASLEKLGSDARVEVVAGRGHGTLFGPPALAMLETIVGNYRRAFPDQAPPAKTTDTASPDAPLQGKPASPSGARP